VQRMPVEMSRLLHHLLGVPDDVIRTDVRQRPEIWGDICGWYYLPGPLTDVRLRTKRVLGSRSSCAAASSFSGS
jgi:hypothetical protein